MAKKPHGQVGPRIPERDLGRETPDLRDQLGPAPLARGVGRVIHPDEAVARVAGRQRGVVTLKQLLRAGLTRGGIEYRLAVGRLHRLFRGVYLVGHAVPPPLAIELGATLACGDGSLLSHGSAIDLWRLLPAGSRDLVDVSITGRRGLTIPGIVIHRPRRIDRWDRTRLHDIPVTSVPRTLLDFAESYTDFRDLERAFSEAQARSLITPRKIEDMLGRSSGRRGAKPLKALYDRAVSTKSHSDLEELLLALVRQARLPEPEMNIVLLGRYKVDFLFRDHRTIAETDGGNWHASQQRRDRDHRRDSELRA